MTVTLPPEKAGAVDDLAGRFHVMTAEPHALVTFGQDAIGSFGVRLDDILAQITHADSPVLFELFPHHPRRREGCRPEGPRNEHPGEAEGSRLERLLLAVGLGDPARRLKKVSDEVRSMLQSKAKSLGDLVRPMEKQIEAESSKLIVEVSRMSGLAQGYRDAIVSLGVFIAAGRRILAQGTGDLARLTAQAGSGDPLRVQEARDAAQKLDLFQNRLLVLGNRLCQGTRRPRFDRHRTWRGPRDPGRHGDLGQCGIQRRQIDPGSGCMPCSRCSPCSR